MKRSKAYVCLMIGSVTSTVASSRHPTNGVIPATECSSLYQLFPHHLLSVHSMSSFVLKSNMSSQLETSVQKHLSAR